MRVAARLLLAFLACATSALRAQTPERFAVYDQCNFADGPSLVENTPLAQGVEGRTVKTVMGLKNVPLSGGTRLMYAWPGTEPFANVKVEEIPAGDYKQARFDLTDNFQQILTADDSSQRNYALKPRLNGFEIYGLDRKKLEGGVLGIYIFFNEPGHIITTIYFLNQEANLRRFRSLEEYAALRDAFLQTFTSCAAGHTQPARPTLPAAPSSSLYSTPPVTTPPLAPATVAVEPVVSVVPPAAPLSIPAMPVPVGPAKASAPTSAALPDVPTLTAPINAVPLNSVSEAPATPILVPGSPATAPGAEPYIPPDVAPLVHPSASVSPATPAVSTAPVSTTPTPAVPEPVSPPVPEAPATTTSTEPYIPSDAAPLVHPRNAADKKTVTKKTTPIKKKQPAR